MILDNDDIGNYMETKNTILSQRDLALLESLMLRYGKLVTFEQIREVLGEDITVDVARKRVAQMSKAGWLIRLKKGLYIVMTDISTLGFVDISNLAIAQMLNDESYISFESALQFHGMFDQSLKRIDSVTTQATKSYHVQQTVYTFSHIKQKLYFGFTQTIINNQTVNIAEKEKAILDILYYRVNDYAISLVLEKLTDYKDELDFEKLKAYSTKYWLGMVRKVGFLLDLVGADTSNLLTDEIKKNSYNKLTQDAAQFNAKWRLYYDPRLTG
jgi:predicted transcriptional regulator of viral defense system